MPKRTRQGRLPGRFRSRWKNRVEDDTQKIRDKGWKKVAADRQQWRLVVRQAEAHPQLQCQRKSLWRHPIAAARRNKWPDPSREPSYGCVVVSACGPICGSASDLLVMVAGTAPPAPLSVGGGNALAGPAALPSSNPQGSLGTTAEVSPVRTSKSSENRRSNKPIMEKRRRARINNCLNELKTLILDAMKKDPARHSKLEKADILEMTVKHLETLQRQQMALAAATDPTVANKFRAGFSECAGEVGRFPGLEGSVKRRLLQHLSNCLNNATPPQPTPTPSPQPLQVHILRTPDSNVIQGLQLVPTRLPNGDIALILPAARTSPSVTTTSPSPSSSSSSPLPLLIPIPARANSETPPPVVFDRQSVTSSMSSSPLPMCTNPSTFADDLEPRLVINEDLDNDDSKVLHIPEVSEMPERSYYDEFEDSESDYGVELQSPDSPLALVTRKRSESDLSEPWRPW